MAQEKDIDAKSVSKEKVATVDGNIGSPNQTVAAIRETDCKSMTPRKLLQKTKRDR